MKLDANLMGLHWDTEIVMNNLNFDQSISKQPL